MKELFKLLLLSLMITLFSCHTILKQSHIHNKCINCKRIRILAEEREKYKSDYFLSSDILDILEEKTGIQANCYKSSYGYWYSSDQDSIFKSDLNKWRAYFNCK